MNVERNVVHGANFSLGAAAKRRLAQGKDFRQIADFKQRHRNVTAKGTSLLVPQLAETLSAL